MARWETSAARATELGLCVSLLLSTSCTDAGTAPVDMSEPLAGHQQSHRIPKKSWKKGWIAVTVPPERVTSETGRSVTISIALRKMPRADVSIPITVSDPSEGRIAVCEVVFTSANYQRPVEVVITGVDDSELDGDQAYSVSFGPALSADKRYAGARLRDLQLVNRDDGEPSWSDAPFVEELEAAGDVCVDPRGNIYWSWGEPYAQPPSAGTTTKLDPAGEPIWSRPLGGDIACDSAGDVVIAQGNVEAASRVVSKLNGQGNVLWQRSYPGILALDGADNVVMIGPRAVRLSPSGELLNELPLDFLSGRYPYWGAVQSRGDLVLATQDTAAGTELRATVMQVSWAGQIVWTYTLELAPEDPGFVYLEPSRATTDSAGNVFFTVRFEGRLRLPDGSEAVFPGASEGPRTADALFKLGAGGEPLWGRFVDYFYDVRDLATDAAGNLVLAAGYFSHVPPHVEPALIQFAPTGERLWSAAGSLPPNTPDYVQRGGEHLAVDIDAHGNIVSTFRLASGVWEWEWRYGLMKRGP